MRISNLPDRELENIVNSDIKKRASDELRHREKRREKRQEAQQEQQKQQARRRWWGSVSESVLEELAEKEGTPPKRLVERLPEGWIEAEVRKSNLPDGARQELRRRRQRHRQAIQAQQLTVGPVGSELWHWVVLGGVAGLLLLSGGGDGR